jgi:ADP-dependent phosphofructokinase/glucokinase
MKIPFIDNSELESNKVFLLSCFSQILEKDRLVAVVKDVKRNLRNLPENTWVVFEDGHYVNEDYKTYVHNELGSYIDVLSMNEEELQELYGKEIDILDVPSVKEALYKIQELIKVPNLVVHSRSWALVSGLNCDNIYDALKYGITMASSRYKYGDNFGISEFREILDHGYEDDACEFCRMIEKSANNAIRCVPSYKLDYVQNPTIVGLGDFFAGGLVVGLSKKNKIMEIKYVR